MIKKGFEDLVLRRTLTAAIFAASISIATEARAQAYEEAPGEGVLCLLGLSSFMAEVADRCATNLSPAAKQELRASVAKLEAYVAASGHMTADEIAKFEADQGGVGAPEAELCHGELRQSFDEGMPLDPTAWRDTVDKAVARPGIPTWGDCL